VISIDRASFLTLPNVASVRLKGGNDRVEFLDVPAGSGFEFCRYIDLIAKLTRARAKFSQIAYRGRPSFFAPGNLFIKDTHSNVHFVESAAHTATSNDEASSSE
jgi:hypothetical protein